MLRGIGLTKRFGGVAAVNEFDLQLAEEELVGLIGPNGAGKTTTLNLLSGTLIPTSGEVSLNGSDLTPWPAHRRAREGIVRTFQLNSLFWNLTLLDNMKVAYYGQRQKGLVWHSILGTTRPVENKFFEKAKVTLERLGIAHLKDRHVSSLPPGLQRVASLGIALMADPKFLLLDEPLAGLSWREADDVMKVLREVAFPSSGIGVLLVEHSVRHVVDFVDRMIAMSFGRKIVEGTAKEVVSHDMVIQSYLGGRL